MRVIGARSPRDEKELGVIMGSARRVRRKVVNDARAPKGGGEGGEGENFVGMTGSNTGWMGVGSGRGRDAAAEWDREPCALPLFRSVIVLREGGRATLGRRGIGAAICSASFGGIALS